MITIVKQPIKESKLIKEKYLYESGRARLLQILNGLIPSIYTFGIITSENPLGIKFPKDINLKRM